MIDVSRLMATMVLSQRGWLSQQPQEFRDQVCQRGKIVRLKAGELIYQTGDGLGGIYGLIHGVVTIDTAPSGQPSKLILVGGPGGWVGEEGYLTRKPRRLTLKALADVCVMHLPLADLDELSRQDPNVARYMASLLMHNVDAFIQIIHDLQIPDTGRRIAAVLHRVAPFREIPLPITQEELGIMANASRKQVNAALKFFTRQSWILPAYRSITVQAPEAMADWIYHRT